jgi:LAGLIDADG endonuclease
MEKGVGSSETIREAVIFLFNKYIGKNWRYSPKEIMSLECIAWLVYPLYGKSMPLPLNRDQFGQWLSGFIDAEGNFQLFFDRHYLRVLFRITLHIDDVEILYTIQKYLGVGTVKLHKTYCVYSILGTADIIEVLISFLGQYPLYTTKYLDYADFKSAVELLYSLPTTRLYGDDLVFVRFLMSRINSGRKEFNYDSIPTLVMNPLWLLGFIEGEGTFGLKNLVPYFQLGQYNRNLMVLQAITLYLASLPNGFNFTLNSQPPKMSNTLNHTTNVNVISNHNIDALYDYLAYYLINMPFQTRKSVDFIYWCLALHFHKFGYVYLPEGRAALVSIGNYINTNRYSTALNTVPEPSLSSIKRVLNLFLPVSLTPEMSHLILAQTFAGHVKSRQVWVYNNGVLIKGSPFDTYASAQEAIGLSRISVVVRRKIDSGKLYLNRYTFFSTKQG